VKGKSERVIAKKQAMILQRRLMDPQERTFIDPAKKSRPRLDKSGEEEKETR